MNTISTINLLPENKAQMKIYSDKLKAELLSGNNDLLSVYKQTRLFIDGIKFVFDEKEVKDALITDAEKYGKSFEHLGAKFQIIERPKYDYSVCENAEYAEILADIEVLESRKKELEKEMQLRCNLKALAVDELTCQILPAPIKTTQKILNITVL